MKLLLHTNNVKYLRKIKYRSLKARVLLNFFSNTSSSPGYGTIYRTSLFLSSLTFVLRTLSLRMRCYEYILMIRHVTSNALDLLRSVPACQHFLKGPIQTLRDVLFFKSVPALVLDLKSF